MFADACFTLTEHFYHMFALRSILFYFLPKTVLIVVLYIVCACFSDRFIDSVILHVFLIYFYYKIKRLCGHLKKQRDAQNTGQHKKASMPLFYFLKLFWP